MPAVLLRPGITVLFDDEDRPLWDDHTWRLSGGEGTKYYIATHIRIDGKLRTRYFHRLIMDPPQGMEVDHINRKRLDNRRCNLRLVTHSQNEQNKTSRLGISGYRNVYWLPRDGKYSVSLCVNKRTIRVGRFTHLADAVEVARQARLQYFVPIHDENQAA